MSLAFFGQRTRHLARAIAVAAQLAAALAGNFAPHHHSLLSTREEISSHVEDRFLTRHDPLSRASHWHGVIAVVHEHDCIACHNHRLPGFLVQRRDTAPVASSRTTTAVRPARTLAAWSSPGGSRAPPDLL
jgi:hypothetical protein